jgi:hypothetical protein
MSIEFEEASVRRLIALMGYNKLAEETPSNELKGMLITCIKSLKADEQWNKKQLHIATFHEDMGR